jgi:hypothetical protein
MCFVFEGRLPERCIVAVIGLVGEGFLGLRDVGKEDIRSEGS